jgi:hypothetical protein
MGNFDASFDELFERIAAGVPCVVEKDAAFLRWRYGPGSPSAGCRAGGQGRGDAARLRRAHGDEQRRRLRARPYDDPGP